MSGCIWKFSQYLDDEDIMFAHRIFVSYKIAGEYYGIGEKPMIRMAWASGAVYKVGKKVLIKREIFEEYLRQHYKQVDKLIEGDEDELLKKFEKRAKEEKSNG
ncbi:MULTISPECIES: excisionase [unclassified Butyrivibrio]|uniref:excisionase n=1 Tax=unclassified Butyrivibrio TaxID=2639466 RepID=UPI0003FDC857|nr:MULTISPECIES: excisionase [unclassified Butyrivibrio]SEK95515.1 transposon Tn916 excisionase [Butyrivibrio sp. ob235]